MLVGVSIAALVESVAAPAPSFEGDDDALSSDGEGAFLGVSTLSVLKKGDILVAAKEGVKSSSSYSSKLDLLPGVVNAEAKGLFV